jgi:predicted RND superfamily exporter protein
VTGGQGGKGPKRRAPLRRWLDGVDTGVDDELNRFFSPTERSRTGEVVDKYAQRVEASIQRAAETAKRTKVDLDALGDDYIDRLFGGGGGARRKRTDTANIGWITNRPKTVFFAVLVVVLVVAVPAVNITGSEPLGVESSMRGDFEVFLPPKDETTLILNEVREHWSTDAMFIYGEMTSRENVTDYAILKALSAIEGDDDNAVARPPDGSGYQEDMDAMAHGIDPWRDDDGKLDGVLAVLSLPMLVKVVNQTVSEVANQLGVSQVPGNYSVPNDQALIDRIIGQMPPDISQAMATDTDGDGIYDRFAIIVLLHKDPKIQVQVMDETRLIVKRVNKEWEGSMVLYVTGPTPLIEAMQDRTIEEFFRVMPLVIIALMLALFVFHRTPSVIPIALVPVSLGLLMSLGIVGALHDFVVITPQVVIIAPVLLALGVSYGLYISNRFAEETEGDAKVRISKAVKAINPAIMLSALTTGIGFASLMIGTLPPIFTMGLALTLGIMFTYIMTYILVPALVVMLKYEKKTVTKGMKAFSTVPSRNRKKIILFTLVAALISVALIPSVRLDADYLAMAPKDDPTVTKMDEYSRYMGGGQLGMFIVRSDPYIYETLDVMDQLTLDVNTVPNTQGISVIDIMKSVSLPETIDVGGNPVPVPPPAQQSLWDAVVYFEEDSLLPIGDSISQQLIDIFYESLPYEVREMLITSEDRQALIYCFMPFMDIDETREAVDGVNAIVASANEVYGERFTSKLTGIAAITLAVNDLIIVSQFNSLAACIFLTFLTLTVIFRSLKIGIVTIIPVICVIALEPGTLVGLDIPLSTITVMIGSIAIGTGVDFSIQISQRIRLGHYKLPSVFGAVERAGTSFVEATSTMLIGFAMVLFIPIDSIQEFVIMIMILLTYNAVFALIVLPAIYTITIRQEERKQARRKAQPPGAGPGRRDRYERAVKWLFRIRDRPMEAGPGTQAVLPLESLEKEQK